METKNPAAQELGRLGGIARHAKLSQTAAGRKKIVDIARKASRRAAELRTQAAKERKARRK